MSIKRTTEQIVALHPGVMLREESLVLLGLSSSALAIALRLPATRILELVHERRGLSADTALRLGWYFGTSAQFRMNMQQNDDLAMAQKAGGAALAQVERRSA